MGFDNMMHAMHEYREEEKKFIFATNQNFFIFSAYTDACTSSCKIVVASEAFD